MLFNRNRKHSSDFHCVSTYLQKKSSNIYSVPYKFSYLVVYHARKTKNKYLTINITSYYIILTEAAMSSMSDRKAELERKKAKLQALRDEKDRRRREKEQKDADEALVRK